MDKLETYADIPEELVEGALKCEREQAEVVRYMRRGWFRALVDRDTQYRLDLQVPTVPEEGLHPVEAYTKFRNGDLLPMNEVLDRVRNIGSVAIEESTRAAVIDRGIWSDGRRSLVPPADYTAVVWAVDLSAS